MSGTALEFSAIEAEIAELQRKLDAYKNASSFDVKEAHFRAAEEEARREVEADLDREQKRAATSHVRSVRGEADRNRRLFGMLRGQLEKAKKTLEHEQSESAAQQRRDAEERVNAKIEEKVQSIIAEKRAAWEAREAAERRRLEEIEMEVSRREAELMIRRLGKHYGTMGRFCMTTCDEKYALFFLPKIHNESTLANQAMVAEKMGVKVDSLPASFSQEMEGGRRKDTEMSRGEGGAQVEMEASRGKEERPFKKLRTGVEESTRSPPREESKEVGMEENKEALKVDTDVAEKPKVVLSASGSARASLNGHRQPPRRVADMSDSDLSPR